VPAPLTPVPPEPASSVVTEPGSDPGGGDAALEARLVALDALLARLEDVPGPTGELAREAVSTLSSVYGEALARVAALVPDITGLAGDQLLGHLLALHGLHPEPAERRIERALASACRSLGGNLTADLAGIVDGVAEISWAATGCGAASGELAAVLRDVVLEAAPELADARAVAAGTAVGQAVPSTFIPLAAIRRRHG
jgi:hypothetical protein